MVHSKVHPTAEKMALQLVGLRVWMKAVSKDRLMAPRMVHSRAFLKDCL